MESEFTLEPDSRLPRWFSLPADFSRGDVTVKLTYYIPVLPVDDVVFELVDLKGRKLAEVTGRHCWHPEIDKIKRNQHGGFDLDSEPRYVIARVNGLVEVIDHPVHGPVFQITDDPTLVKQANDSVARGECRK